MGTEPLDKEFEKMEAEGSDDGGIIFPMPEGGFPDPAAKAILEHKWGGNHGACKCPQCGVVAGHHPSCKCPHCGEFGGNHNDTCECTICGKVGKHDPSCMCPLCGITG